MTDTPTTDTVTGAPTATISSIVARTIYNSHAGPTKEFELTLDDGTTMAVASSAGETVGIHEDQGDDGRTGEQDPTLAAFRERVVGRPLDQTALDQELASMFDVVGRNAANAVSEAFFRAQQVSHPTPVPADAQLPRIVINVENGGHHAYTNPVLSDFPEYIFVPRTREVTELMPMHDEIQRVIRERLAGSERMVVGGNSVNVVGARDNRAVVDFLVGVRDDLGLRDQLDLWVDASAGDLYRDGCYDLDLTESSPRTSEQMVQLWTELVRDHGVTFVEDPFQEEDLDAWTALMKAVGDDAVIVGDNFYSTDADRIARAAEQGHANGALIKPNQAGTVTRTRAAIAAAQRSGQQVITSHRSISTESTFLSWLTIHDHVDFMKIGPLQSDYSSVLRLNEMIRLLEKAGR